MDALIASRLRQVSAETDAEKLAVLKEQSNQEFGEHFARNHMDMEELAFDLLNLSWSDAGRDDIVRDVIEVKTVGLGDPDYIEEDLRGMRAYWQGKGGQIRSDIMRYERSQMPREEIVAAIDMHQDELVLDFWGAFSKLTGQIQAKIRQVPVERLIELVQASITGGATYGSFAASTLTDAQVDSVLDPVALKSGGMATLLGTSVAVRKLARVGLDFADVQKDQIFRTGVIAGYKGYNVLQVENFENFEGEFVLPSDEIWIIGKNAGRLTYYGSAAKVQQLRLPSFMLRWETARDAGMLLYGAAKGRIGRIKLT